MTANINILLIDTRVSHYDAILAAIDPALSVGITFDYYTDTFDTLKERMASSGVHANSVGLVQHNYRIPKFKMVDAQITSSTIEQVETYDNELSTWAPLKEFIEWCKTELSIAHFDMMACALYSNNDWKYVIDTLSTQTGVEIRASTDDTGSSSLGGNWFLESHVGVNLKNVYFNESIANYTHILDYKIFNNYPEKAYTYTTQIPTITTLPSRPPAPPTNPTLPLPAPTLPARPTLSGYTVSYGVYNEVQGNGGSVVSYGDDMNSNCSFSKVSAQLQSGVAFLFSSGAALKTNGSLVLWGNFMQSANTMVPTTANLSSNVCSMCRSGNNICALKNDGSVVFWGNFSSGYPAFPSDLSSGVNFVTAGGGQDFACLKSDGSIRGWGSNVFQNSSSVPPVIYPAGSNLDSGFVKLVSYEDIPSGTQVPVYAAIKTNGSVVFFGGTSATNHFTNPTTFYPTGSNINSGVVDVFILSNYFLALKSDGSLVAWGAGAASANVNGNITGKTAVKVIQTQTRANVILSDGTYVALGSEPSGSEGTFTNIVDIIESIQYNRFLFLKSDGTLAWRGNNNFGYYYSVGINVFTNVVKMWNDPNGQFNQGAIVLTSNGELRNLIQNILIASDVNDAFVSLNYVTYITSTGKVRVIRKVWNGSRLECVTATSLGGSTNAPYPTIRANGAGQESATSLLVTLNDDIPNYQEYQTAGVCTVLKTAITYPYLFVFNGSTYATCPYNQYSTALDLVTGHAGTSSSVGGNSFTIETWYYQPQQTLNSTIVDRGNYCYLFQVSPNANSRPENYGCLGFYNTAVFGGWIYATSAVVATSGWTHIAMTRSGTSYKFYINGVLKQTIGGPGTLNRDDGVFGIGTQLAGTSTGGNYINSGCSMYDLRLWCVARTDDEIKSYMNVSVQPSSFGLVANYLFNDNENIFYDRTRNGFNCTIGGNYSSSLWNTYHRNSKPTTSSASSIGVFLNPDYTLVRESYFTYSVGTGPLMNLVKTDFTGANLTGINFSGRDLTGVNFSGANLTNVNFSNAILTGIIVNKSTKFTGANFSGATMRSMIGTLDPTLIPANYLHYFSNVNLVNVLVDYNNANTSIALPPTSITNYAVHFAAYYNFKKSNARFYISWGTNSNALSFSSSSYTPKVRFQIIQRFTNVVGLDVLFDYADGKGCIETNVPFYIDRGNEENSSVSDESPANRHIPLRFRLWGELLNGVRSSSYAEIVTGSLPLTQFSLFDNILTSAPSWYTSITTNSNSSRYGGYISYMSNSKLILNGNAGATYYDWTTNIPYTVPGTPGAWRALTMDRIGNSVYISPWSSNAWYRYELSTNSLTALYSSTSFGNTVCNSTGTRAYANDMWKLLVYNATTNTAYATSHAYSDLRNMYIDKNDKYVVTSSLTEVIILNIQNDANTVIAPQIAYYSNLSSCIFDDSSTFCYVMFNRTQYFTNERYIYKVNLSNGHWSYFITLPAAPGSMVIINKYIYIFGMNTSTQFSRIDTTSASITIHDFPAGYSSVNQVYETNEKNVYCVMNYNGVYTIIHFTGAFDNVSGIILGPSINYSNANLSNYQLSKINFTGSNFSNATITNTSFVDSNLTNTTLPADTTTADFTGATVSGATFADSLFDYVLDANNNATVTKYRGPASVVFPEKVNNAYTITAIADNIDWGVASFTNFSFSATCKLVSIGANAFKFRAMGILTSPFGAKKFFPPTLTTIGSHAFYYATISSSPEFPSSNDGTFAAIILPSGVNSIGTNAFEQFPVLVKLKPTLTWSSALITPRQTGSTFTYTATSSAAVGYTGYNGSGASPSMPVYYASTNQSVATINSSTGLVTVVGAGTVTFTASQDSDNSYFVRFTSADTITSATLTVTKGTPTLSNVTLTKTYGDAAFQVTAPEGSSVSGGTMRYAFLSGDNTVASITESGLITINKAGTAVIFSARQDETSSFYAPTPVTVTLTVSKATPTLSNVTISKTYGNAAFQVTAPEGSSVSGGTLRYAYLSGNTAVASITESGLITINKAGTVVFSVRQDATSNYNAPAPVSVTLTVGKASTTLSGFTIPPKTYTYGVDTSFVLTSITSESNGALNYSSNNSAVASIDGSRVVTIKGAGTVTFTATQDETDNYNPPALITATLTVFKGTTTIVVSNISKNTADLPFTFASSSESDGVRTFRSSDPSVATIDLSGVVTIGGIVGTTTITVSQVETTNYNAPSDATAILTVTKGTPILSSFTIASKYFGELPFEVTAPASQNTIGAFRYTSSTLSVAKITDSGTITIFGAGVTTITANQDPTADFNAPTAITTTFTVLKATPTIVVSDISKSSIDPAFTFARSSESNGNFSFNSNNESVAKINSVSGLVTIVSAGTAVITVSQAESSNHVAPTNATATLTVTAGTLTNAVIESGANLSGKNLSGASLASATLTNVILSNSNLNGADFSGANVEGTDFTNTSIVGATNLPTFSTKQKLQLLYDANNAGANISQLQFSAPLSVSELNAALSVSIPELLTAKTEFIVAAPVYDQNVKTVTIAPQVISTVNNTSFYIPLNKGESVKINGLLYTLNEFNQLLDETGSVLKLLVINNTPFKIYAGSIIAVNITDILNRITFDFSGQVGLYDLISSMINAALTQSQSQSQPQ
jgi:uncharacterized protein YjbI with pentapeptide repeats